MEKKERDIELEDDIRKSRRSWKVKRVAWGVLILILLLGMSGLFGDGWLSQTKAGSPGEALWVEYERFLHRETSYRMDIHLQAMPDSQLVFSLDQQYLRHLVIEQISPEPETMEHRGELILFTFKSGPGSSERIISLHIRPQRTGCYFGVLRSGKSEQQLNHLVYP